MDKGGGNKRPSAAGLGCMGVAIAGGFLLGLNAGGRVLPGGFSWLFAVMFALFFGVLGYVFYAMSARRDRGVVSETFWAIPQKAPATLKRAIEQANPPSELDEAQVARLDAALAELDELSSLLYHQPRAGAAPPIKARLEELAQEWLDDRAVQAWLAGLSPKTEI